MTFVIAIKAFILDSFIVLVFSLSFYYLFSPQELSEPLIFKIIPFEIATLFCSNWTLAWKGEQRRLISTLLHLCIMRGTANPCHLSPLHPFWILLHEFDIPSFPIVLRSTIDPERMVADLKIAGTREPPLSLLHPSFSSSPGPFPSILPCMSAGRFMALLNIPWLVTFDLIGPDNRNYALAASRAYARYSTLSSYPVFRLHLP